VIAPDPLLIERFVQASEVLAGDARLLFGAEAGKLPDFADALTTLTGDERELVELMFTQGAQCAVGVLVQRGLLQVPDLLDAFDRATP
jgi:hypothetical protein